MKTLKKLTSLLLALVMVVGLAVPAYATEVTIDTESNNGILADHTFFAYQIFSGTLSSDGQLTNIEWGNGVRDGLLTRLKDRTNSNWLYSYFTNAQTAADVAEIVSGFGNDSEEAQKFAKLVREYMNNSNAIELTAGSENNLADGYYLIIDTTEKSALDQGDAFNAALLQVAGEKITIDVKTDAPTVEKKVYENTKYADNDGYGNGYNDVADYNIGDEVPYLLIGSIPDLTYFNASSYQYIFHDRLSAGLTAPTEPYWETFKIYLSEDKQVDESDTDIVDWFDIRVLDSTNSDGHAIFYDGGTEIKISANTGFFTQIKNGTLKGKYILVQYSATLNENAVVGKGNNTQSENSSTSQCGDPTTDQATAANVGNPNTVFLQYSPNPDADECYHTPDDVVTVFTYELDVNKVDATDNTKMLDAQFKLHNAEDKWLVLDENNKVTGWVDSEENATVLQSGESGTFSIIGLDDGTYYLKETEAPKGYNKLAKEVEVAVSATTTNGQTWDGATHALTAISVKVDDGTAVDGDVSNGTVKITVENTSGSTLPSTGGVGTTLFYVVGAILILSAGSLLVLKRRSNLD